MFQRARFLVKNEKKQDKPSTFYLEHIFGAWIVLAMGHILAALTFSYEYFSQKKAQEKQSTIVTRSGPNRPAEAKRTLSHMAAYQAAV